MRRAMLLVAATALFTAGSGAGASTKRVSITDNALSPVVAVIATGDNVQWTNKGSRQHRVKSAQGTFPAFTLQPGKSMTVKFDTRGCVRYKVDDRLNGRVLVGVSSCPGGSSPPPPGGGGGGGNKPPPKGGETTHRYNVKTVASVEEVYDTYENPLTPSAIGVVTTKIRWTGTWANMRVRVFNGDDLNISGEAKGLIQATYSLVDTRASDRCNQAKSKTLKGTASVSGWLGRDRDSATSFDSRTDFFNVALCARGNTLVGVIDRATVGGIAFGIDECCGQVFYKREGRGMFFPIATLRDGKAFTVTTGTRTSSRGCDSPPVRCRHKLSWNASVAFTPVR